MSTKREIVSLHEVVKNYGEGIVITKHANPCGVSVEKNQLLSL